MQVKCSLPLIFNNDWRDICTRFHIVCPGSASVCHKSNVELTSVLKNQLQMHWRRCDNDLFAGATPIIVDGVHLVNLASGHFEKVKHVFAAKKKAGVYPGPEK